MSRFDQDVEPCDLHSDGVLMRHRDLKSERRNERMDLSIGLLSV